MQEWNFEVGGKRVTISVVRAPNGKMIVRANGRIATPALAEGEQERSFTAEGAQFHLQRIGDSFQVEQVVGEEPEPEPGFVVHTSEAPQTASESEVVQRHLKIFGAAGVALLGACFLLRLLMTSEIARLVTKRAFTLEMLVGFALIGGAALLLLRVAWAPSALYFATWGIGAVALLGMIDVDLRAHRQIASAADPADALRFLGSVHWSGLILLVLAAGASGALLSQLNREGLRAELQRTE